MSTAGKVPMGRPQHCSAANIGDHLDEHGGNHAANSRASDHIVLGAEERHPGTQGVEEIYPHSHLAIKAQP